MIWTNFLLFQTTRFTFKLPVPILNCPINKAPSLFTLDSNKSDNKHPIIKFLLLNAIFKFLFLNLKNKPYLQNDSLSPSLKIHKHAICITNCSNLLPFFKTKLQYGWRFKHIGYCFKPYISFTTRCPLGQPLIINKKISTSFQP